MSTRHHVRSGSYGRKVISPLTKTTRPALSAKRSLTSSTCASIGSRTASRPTSKSGPSHDGSDEDDYEDTASFLQFCATCEKQIVTPFFSVLYCSEACKRRDSTRSTSLPVSAPASPLSAALNSLPPYRSPTVLRPVSKTYSELSLYELNSDKGSKQELGLLYDSTFGMPTQVRPAFERSSTSPEASRVPSLVPSLDHSPCSSYGAEAATIDSARPLPRKHSCPHHRGIELVTPILACVASDTQESRRRSAPLCSARQRI